MWLQRRKGGQMNLRRQDPSEHPNRTTKSKETPVMKKTLLPAAMAVAIALVAMTPRANAAEGDNITFNLKVSAGAAACLKPNAGGRVTVSDLGLVQNLHVETTNLPPNTEFTVFLLQVPHSPFGLSWYHGDIRTNGDGRAVGDFTGIF